MDFQKTFAYALQKKLRTRVAFSRQSRAEHANSYVEGVAVEEGLVAVAMDTPELRCSTQRFLFEFCGGFF